MAARKVVDQWAQFEFMEDLPVSLKPGQVVGDPVQIRRKKMTDSISAQIELWRNPEFTITKKRRRDGHLVEERLAPRPWFKRQGDAIYLSPRYGVRPFVVVPGKPVVKLSQAQVPAFLDTLREAVFNGDFDDQLAKLAVRERVS